MRLPQSSLHGRHNKQRSHRFYWPMASRTCRVGSDGRMPVELVAVRRGVRTEGRAGGPGLTQLLAPGASASGRRACPASCSRLAGALPAREQPRSRRYVESSSQRYGRLSAGGSRGTLQRHCARVAASASARVPRGAAAVSGSWSWPLSQTLRGECYSSTALASASCPEPARPVCSTS